ncbi:hypothetical protein VTH06DRAFT_471 [Thermothelomyces fergusii]
MSLPTPNRHQQQTGQPQSTICAQRYSVSGTETLVIPRGTQSRPWQHSQSLVPPPNPQPSGPVPDAFDQPVVAASVRCNRWTFAQERKTRAIEPAVTTRNTTSGSLTCLGSLVPYLIEPAFHLGLEALPQHERSSGQLGDTSRCCRIPYTLAPCPPTHQSGSPHERVPSAPV